ncbi:multidrug transporter, partial [Acinetobacter baumannii]
MIIGAFLILTWLVLLLRYPAKALPISLAAVLGLGLVALWVVWQDQREASQLARLDLRLTYAPEHCPA